MILSIVFISIVGVFLYVFAVALMFQVFLGIIKSRCSHCQKAKVDRWTECYTDHASLAMPMAVFWPVTAVFGLPCFAFYKVAKLFVAKGTQLGKVLSKEDSK